MGVEASRIAGAACMRARASEGRARELLTTKIAAQNTTMSISLTVSPAPLEASSIAMRNTPERNVPEASWRMMRVGEPPDAIISINPAVRMLVDAPHRRPKSALITVGPGPKRWVRAYPSAMIPAGTRYGRVKGRGLPLRSAKTKTAAIAIPSVAETMNGMFEI